MTSLSSQLQRLQQNQKTQGQNFKENERPSILFSFKDAASISVSRIKELAQEGFIKLQSHLPQLNSFTHFLFSEKYDNLDRQQISDEENKQISEKVKNLLLLLSQTLTNQNTMKVIEYLLRNFDIHQYESQEMIVYFMHYHNKPIYIKFLQNIDLNDKQKWFINFDSLIKQGNTIDRSQLGKLLQHSLFIFNNLLDFNLSYLQYHKIYSKNDNYVSTFNAQSNPQEFLSFKFFIIFMIEQMDKMPQNFQFKLNCKIYLFQVLKSLSQNQELSLAQGFILLTLYLSQNKILNENEVLILIKSILEKQIQNDNINHQLLKLILCLIQTQSCVLSIEILSILFTEYLNDLNQILKYHSSISFLFQIFQVLSQNLQNLTKNDILTITEGLKIVLENLNFNSINEIDHLYDKISELFFECSQKGLDIYVYLFKQIKQSFNENICQLLERKYEVLNYNLEHTTENKETIRNNFRLQIKQVYGEVWQYGYSEEIAQNNQRSVFLMKFSSSSHQQKIGFINKIKKTFNSIEPEQKEFIKNKIKQALAENTNLQFLIELYKECIQLFSKDEKNELIKSLIDRLISQNILIPENLLQELKQELMLETIQDNKVRVFTHIIIKSRFISKNEEQKFIKEIIKDLFEIELDSLLEIFKYFSIYDEDQTIIPMIIERMIDSPLIMKMTKKNIEDFIQILKTSFQLLSFLKEIKPSKYEIKKDDLLIKLFSEIEKNLQKVEKMELFSVLKVIGEFMIETKCTQMEIQESIFNFIFESIYDKSINEIDFSLLYLMKIKVCQKQESGNYNNKQLMNFFIFLGIEVYTQNLDLDKSLLVIEILQKISHPQKEIEIEQILSKIIVTSSFELSSDKREIIFKKLKKFVNSSFSKNNIQMKNFIEQNITHFQNNLSRVHSILTLITYVDYGIANQYFQFIKNEILKNPSQNQDFKRLCFLILKFDFLNQNWIDYLSFIKQIKFIIDPNQFLKEVRSSLGQTPVFIKVITYFQFMNTKFDLLSFSDLHLNLEEICLLLIVFTSINQNLDDRKTFLQFIKTKVKQLISQVQKSPDNLCLLFILLKVLFNDFETNSSIIDLIVDKIYENQSMIKYSNQQNCFKDELTSQFQDDSFNMHLKTIKDQLNQEITFFNDFVIKKKNFCIINIDAFISQEIQINILSLTQGLIKNFTNDQQDPQGERKLIQTIIDYVFLFFKFDPKSSFDLIERVLEVGQNQVEVEKQILFSKIKNQEINKLNFNQMMEKVTNQEKSIIFKIDHLEFQVKQIFHMTIQSINKLKQEVKYFYLIKTLHGLYQFMDTSIRGGLQNLLNQSEFQQTKNFYQISKQQEELQSLLSNYVQSDLNTYIFSLVTYFLLQDQKVQNLKTLIHYIGINVQNFCLEQQNLYQEKLFDFLIYLQKFLYVLFNGSISEFTEYINPQILLQLQQVEQYEERGTLIKRKLMIIYSLLHELLLQDTLLTTFLKKQSIQQFQQGCHSLPFQKSLSEYFIFFSLNDQKIKQLKAINKEKNSILVKQLSKTQVQLNLLRSHIFPIESFIDCLQLIVDQSKSKDYFNKLVKDFLIITNNKLSHSSIKKTYNKHFAQILINLSNQLLLSQEIQNKSTDQLYKEFIQLIIHIQQKQKKIIDEMINNDKQFLFNLLNRLQTLNCPLSISLSFKFLFDQLVQMNRTSLKIFNQLIHDFLGFTFSFIKCINSQNLNVGQLKTYKTFELIQTDLNENIIGIIQNCLIQTLQQYTNFMQPFIKDIIVLSSMIQELKQEIIINSLIENIDHRIGLNSLIEIFNLDNSSFYFENSLYYLKSLLSKLDQETFVDKREELYSLFIKIFGILEQDHLAKQPLNADNFKLTYECFASFALKCNVDELRNYFVQLKKWAKEKSCCSENFRSFTLISVQNEIMDKLGELGVYTYSENLEITCNLLIKINNPEKSILNNDHQNLFIQIIRNLSLLLKNDKEHFVDSYVFEKISQALCSYLHQNLFIEKKSIDEFYEKNFYFIFQDICNIKTDENQIKNLIAQICKCYNTNDNVIRLVSIKTLKNMVQGLQGGALLHLNYLLHQIRNIMNDEIQENQKIGKEILDIIQMQTEDDLEELILEEYKNFD